LKKTRLWRWSGRIPWLIKSNQNSVYQHIDEACMFMLLACCANKMALMVFPANRRIAMAKFDEAEKALKKQTFDSGISSSNIWVQKAYTEAR